MVAWITICIVLLACVCSAEGYASGVLADTVTIAALQADGFTSCYDEPYSTPTTSAILTTNCRINSADTLFVGGLASGSTTFTIGAYGTAGNVLATTSSTTLATANNGAYWYFLSGRGFGFADIPNISTGSGCDITAGPLRLCWNLVTGAGGYRVGDVTFLTTSTAWRKVIYRRASLPTMLPSKTPTTQPVKKPTAQPTHQPSNQPSSQPTAQPTLQPVGHPTALPSGQPSARPSMPTYQPSSQPTSRPSSQPTLSEKSLTSLENSLLPLKIRNLFAFAALNSSGGVITWGSAADGGDSSAVAHLLVNVTKIVASENAFAALKRDGSVVCWGLKTDISGCSSLSSGGVHVVSLQSTDHAFAGLTSAGGVVVCGAPTSGGKIGTHAASLTSGVVSIVANQQAFVALKSDGTVFSWGNVFAGGGVSSLTMPSLQNVKSVTATYSSFAALTANGKVVTWGSANTGGKVVSAQVTNQLSRGIPFVWSGKSAFIAFNGAHSVKAVWGRVTLGGDASSVTTMLTSGVKTIARSDGAFAVLKTDGSVVSWGGQSYGGDSVAVASQLLNITHIYSNSRAFAALNATGGVVTWGDVQSGGYSNDSLSHSGVVKVVSTRTAFAALKVDGSVVVWGNAHYGGEGSSAVAALLTSGVKLLCANEVAFTAIKMDGTAVVWGNKMSVANEGLLSIDGRLSTITSCDY